MKQNKKELTTQQPSLSKFIAQAGICARRKATELIQNGAVKVNGIKITEPGYKLKPSDTVTVHGRTVEAVDHKVYILLHKPAGYITTVADELDRKTVMDFFVGVPERIYPVGRLDKDTSGLLLLTNDGALAQKLSHPRNEIQKIYHVTLNEKITPHVAERIRDGVMLEDGILHVDELLVDSNDYTLTLTIHSGKNRVIRRLFEALGYHVTRLERIQYACLKSKGLTAGNWRYLTELEINRLLKV